MKRTDLEENVSVLTTGHGEEILYVNGEAVAGYSSIDGWFKIKAKHSVDTSGHIEKYLRHISEYTMLTNEELEAMFALENRT